MTQFAWAPSDHMYPPHCDIPHVGGDDEVSHLQRTVLMHVCSLWYCWAQGLMAHLPPWSQHWGICWHSVRFVVVHGLGKHPAASSHAHPMLLTQADLLLTWHGVTMHGVGRAGLYWHTAVVSAMQASSFALLMHGASAQYPACCVPTQEHTFVPLMTRPLHVTTVWLAHC